MIWQLCNASMGEKWGEVGRSGESNEEQSGTDLERVMRIEEGRSEGRRGEGRREMSGEKGEERRRERRGERIDKRHEEESLGR